MKRILALDVGDARIGVAVSDPLLIAGMPLCTVERKKKYLDQLVEIIKEKDVDTIVIGLPLMPDGSEGIQAINTREFEKKLSAVLTKKLEVSLNIIYRDERYSTKQAELALRGTRLKNKQKSAALDQSAASLILSSYLDEIR